VISSFEDHNGRRGCNVILETFFEGRKRDEIAQRVGISANTYDNHLKAALRSVRHLLTQDADMFTDVDRSRWCDLIEELRERYRAARLRHASGKTGERSTSEGDRGKTAGDGSNSVGGARKTDGDAGSTRVHRSNVRHDRGNVGSHPD
jgi:hypothetical protein